MKNLAYYKILRTYRFRILSSGKKIRQVNCKNKNEIKNLDIRYSWESLFRQSGKNIYQGTKEYTESDVSNLLLKSKNSWEIFMQLFDILEKEDKNYHLWFCIILKTSFLKKINVNEYYKHKRSLGAEESLKMVQGLFFSDIKEFFRKQHRIIEKDLEQINLYQKEQNDEFASHLKTVAKTAYLESVKKVFEKTKYLYWLLENFRVFQKDDRLSEKERKILNLFNKKEINEKKIEIENILEVFSDKTGIHIFSGGFNRFILNKKSKAYEEDIMSLQKDIKELEEKKWGMKNSQELFKRACESLIGKSLLDASHKSLDILDGQTPIQIINIFCEHDKKDCINDFIEKYKENSKQIKILHKEIQQLDSENEGDEIGRKRNKQVKLKKLRGELFKALNSYQGWEKEYKRVSQKLGSSQSTVKQKEFLQHKIDDLQYYTTIIQYDDFYFLLGMPKENKEILLDEFKQSNNSKIVAYQFHSLMARSLEFLMFIDSALNFEEKKEYNFQQAEKVFQDKKFIKEHCNSKKGENYQENRNKLIIFYQQVLKKSHLIKQSNWDIFNFRFKDSLEYKSLDEFYADIDKQGYLVEKKYLSKIFLQDLVEKYKGFIMPIYNRDFAPKRNQDKKLMQTQYFEEVFSEENKKANYPIRLGPESKIFYRPVLEKKEVKKIEYEKNRFFRKEFHAHFNIELNGNSPVPSIKTGEYGQHIGNFSKAITLEMQQKENYYFYGIDRGLHEIATLCILDKNGNFVFTDESYNVISKEAEGAKPLVMDLSDKIASNDKIIESKNMAELVKKDIDYRRLVYVLNTGNEFLNEYVEMKNMQSGDFSTIIRKLFPEKLKFKEDGTEKGKEHLFILNQIFTTWQKKRNTIIDNKKFVLELPKSIDRKNAIAGNIAGVLSFLMRRLPGFIVFENLDFQKDEKGKKITTHKEQELERWVGSVLYQQIEISLAQKFQYMVESKKSVKGIQLMPFLKNADILKQIAKKMQEWQFGNFLYIPSDYTSQMCPKCFKIAKRKNNNIVCSYCKYDMNIDKSIPLENGDQNAAYHIARLGVKKLNKNN